MASASPSEITNGKKPLVKPEKPDEEAYKAKLKQAEKAHVESMAKLNSVKSKLDMASTSSNNSSIMKTRAELLAQLKEIREKQSLGKTGRNKIIEQIKKEEAILKDMVSQQRTARSRVNFKSIEDLNREIERLDKQISSGTMKIVDERKTLDIISSLYKQRKIFSVFDESLRDIEAKKVIIKQLRELLDDPESKALSENYTKIQSELDVIKAEQDEIYKNINSLRDERKKLQDDQQTKFLLIKELKHEYYEKNKAVQKWENEARQRIRDKKKAEEESYQQEKKRIRAQQILAEASDKAFLEEIRRAQSLLHFLDPTYSTEKAPPLQPPSKFQATPQRQVNGSEIKGVKITKKEEEDYFIGTGGKKARKSRKMASKEKTVVSKYSCPPVVMEDCAFMGIDPPMSAADIPEVKEKVLAKLNYWKCNQDSETENNIAKARKQLELIEIEESTGSNSPSFDSNPHFSDASKTTNVSVKGGNTESELTLQNNTQDNVAVKV